MGLGLGSFVAKAVGRDVGERVSDAFHRISDGLHRSPYLNEVHQFTVNSREVQLKEATKAVMIAAQGTNLLPEVSATKTGLLHGLIRPKVTYEIRLRQKVEREDQAQIDREKKIFFDRLLSSPPFAGSALGTTDRFDD